jgi:hypothetical protein
MVTHTESIDRDRVRLRNFDSILCMGIESVAVSRRIEFMQIAY